MSAALKQAAQAKSYIVSVVLTKQGREVVNVQNKLYCIEVVSSDEAIGKSISLSRGDFPDHQFHTACFWELEAAPQQAQAPGPCDSQMLDWLALNSKTCTVHMNGQHPYKPNHKIMAMTGPTYRDAIRSAMRGAAPQGDKP